MVGIRLIQKKMKRKDFSGAWHDQPIDRAELTQTPDYTAHGAKEVC